MSTSVLHRSWVNPFALLTVLILACALCLVGLISIYWYRVLEPSLNDEYTSRTNALAEANAKRLGLALSDGLEVGNFAKVRLVEFEILSTMSPDTGVPFFRRIELELDPDLFSNFPQGKPHPIGDLCEHCLLTKTPVFDEHTKALLGVVSTYASTSFINLLKKSVRDRLFMGSLVGLLLLLGIWYAVYKLIVKIKTSEEFFHGIFDTTLIPMMMTNPFNATIIRANQGAADLFGLPIEELEDRTMQDFLDNFEDLRPAIRALRHDGRVERFSLQVTTAQGQHRWILGSAVPVGTRKNKHIVIGMINITERIELEHQLQAARVSAEQASEAKSMFLANISHEVRTPINGILGFISMMYKTSLATQQRQYLEPIETSARHLLSLVNGLLDLSRIEAGELTFLSVPFDFKRCVEDAVEAFVPLAKQRDLLLGCKIDNEIPPALYGDETRIRQVVTNLVNNAIKFTAHGKVSVLVECAPIKNKRNGVMLTIDVIDTGIGMHADEIEGLFKPFRQSESSISRRYGGVGLGLTITKTLVEAMQGTIIVDSKPGISTRVCVRIPFVTCDVAELLSQDGDEVYANNSINGTGLSVLVVDDNQINTQFLTNLLSYHNISSVAAESGVAAIEQAINRQFDLVLMDIHMPQMDGIETTKILRQRLKQATPPIIAVTADILVTPSDHQDSVFDGLIEKPVVENDLIWTLAKWFPERVSKKSTDHDIHVIKPPDEVLDMSYGLAMASGDHDLWLSSCRQLSTQLVNGLEQIRNLLTGKQDLNSVAALAHKLAGSASYTGAGELAGALKRLDRHCREQDLLQLDQHLEELDGAIESYVNVVAVL